MIKKQIILVYIAALLTAPGAAFALNMPAGLQMSAGLQMPQSGNQLASMIGFGAQAYVVADAQTGQVLISKNPNLSWTPASLTKLVTALVVLDTNPNLNKTVAMAQADQVLGGCKSGGACIAATPGVKFTVNGLFHAALMPSANNAASALARSTGLSMDDFVARMNQKAASLGAVNSHFYEPTGMNPQNSITAGDYVKIVTAAFSNSYLQGIAGLGKYALRSSNNSRYNQTIKNTDQLASDPDIKMLGAKTGYLNEAGYNFGALLNYDGQELAVVVLGEQHLFTAFAETKQLASLAKEAQYLAIINPIGAVLGTTTAVTSTTNN